MAANVVCLQGKEECPRNSYLSLLELLCVVRNLSSCRKVLYPVEIENLESVIYLFGKELVFP